MGCILNNICVQKQPTLLTIVFFSPPISFLPKRQIIGYFKEGEKGKEL